MRLYPAKRLEECKAAIDWLDPEEVSMSIADVARANASRNHLGEAQRVWAEDRLRDLVTDRFGALYAPTLTGGEGSRTIAQFFRQPLGATSGWPLSLSAYMKRRSAYGRGSSFGIRFTTSARSWAKDWVAGSVL